MFQTFSKKGIDISSIDTIIGATADIQGIINSRGAVRIDGKQSGDINCQSTVIIGENGYIKGNIVASGVSISGKVDGNITCKGLLEILPGGKLLGDIEVQNISISDGAIFKGKCNMISEQIQEAEAQIEQKDCQE